MFKKNFFKYIVSFKKTILKVARKSFKKIAGHVLKMIFKLFYKLLLEPYKYFCNYYLSKNIVLIFKYFLVNIYK